MGGISQKAWFRKALVSLAGRPRLKEFNKMSCNLKSTQELLLKRIIHSCKNTAFGKAHDFGKIKTIHDYRKAVPIGDFERHRIFVDRMCKGEENVLFMGKPLFYNTTSGTTAKPKLIPVSKDYFENAYSGLSKLWLYTCLRDNPSIYDGKSLSAVSAAEEGCVADGTPYGSISGMVYKNIPAVLKSTFCTPYQLICIQDYLKKYYAMVRCALESNITIIVSPSPSNILRFHQTIMEYYPELVKDIHDGTLRKDIVTDIAPDNRESVQAYFKPNPQRAKELEKIYSKYGDLLRPKHYWPRLALVNTWKQGNFALLLPKLHGFFSESAVVRAFGYQASEARAGIVMGNEWDYSVLAAHIYHFEFIEENAKDQQNPPVVLPGDVEVGKRYYIIFTNGSGLYRYDINDIVEIVGFYNQIPLFKFIQKGEGVTNLTGEKLSEIQIIQAVNEAAQQQGVTIEFYTMICDKDDFCYKLFVEFTPHTAQEKKGAFHAAVDSRLRSINLEYEVKRGTNRLSPPHIYELAENSHERQKEILIAQGLARAGQYKETYLSTKKELLTILEKLVIKS